MAPPRRAAARGPGRFDRRPWASGTTVFEIDQPSVVEWKTRTLREMDAEPSAWLRTVAVDLRHDWPAALRAAGFDPAAATAWSAEGLLAFLPSDAQDRLLDNITALSAPGSRLIAEDMSGRDGAATATQDRMSETVDRWRAHGFDIEMTDLWYLGDRHDVADISMPADGRPTKPRWPTCSPSTGKPWRDLPMRQRISVHSPM